MNDRQYNVATEDKSTANNGWSPGFAISLSLKFAKVI